MKKKFFIILTSAYFIITVADLLLTFIATPDLAMEGNPLVVNLKMDWLGLIIINVITFAAYFAMAYYAYIKYKSPVSDEKKDLRRYLADITYGDPNKVNAGMWRLPKYWAPQIACLCFSVATALPFARLIVVVEWILIIKDISAPLFFSIIAIFPMGRIDYFIALFIAWGLTLVWIQIEFKQNQKAPLKADNDNI
ncbi:MAG TPA: hypothetical protein DCR23_01950 [Ruminococcaceae bacterium]|nr:hypothetical protein [Oscillospiraceae bacterium]